MDDLKAKRGQSESVEAFLSAAMERWGDTVLRLALNQMRDRTDAEDVFQDVFMRLLDHDGPFNGEEHLKAWLLRTTVNRCHDLQRRSKRKSFEALDDDMLESSAASKSGNDDPLAELLRSDVWGMVGRLPDELSAIVHLFYAEGYRTPEIARIIGRPEATVRTRLHRARCALKTMIEDESDHSERTERSRTGAPPALSASHGKGGMRHGLSNL